MKARRETGGLSFCAFVQMGNTLFILEQFLQDDGELFFPVPGVKPDFAEAQFAVPAKKDRVGNASDFILLAYRLGQKHGKSGLLFFYKSTGGVLVFFNVDGQKLDVLGFELIIEGDEVRKLRTTGPSPTGPKIHEDHFSPERGKFDFGPGQIGHLEVFGFFGDEFFAQANPDAFLFGGQGRRH